MNPRRVHLQGHTGRWMHKIMKRMSLVVSTLSLCCLCGCGTLITRIPSEPSSVCYPATRYDSYIIGSGGGIYAYGDCDNGLGPVLGWSVVVPLHIVDLPISLVTDTILLPFDFKRSRIRAEEESREFPLLKASVSTNAPDLMLVSVSRGDPAFFRYLPSGDTTFAFPGNLIEPPDSTNTYKLISIWDDRVILRKEKPSNH